MHNGVDSILLFSIAGWIGIGLAVGSLTYTVLIRRPQRPMRADLSVVLILGLVGALIGGAIGWSMHGGMNEVLASLLSGTFGALLLCVVFQFIVPV